jgi:hypothetical protein
VAVPAHIERPQVQQGHAGDRPGPGVLAFHMQHVRNCNFYKNNMIANNFGSMEFEFGSWVEL